MNNFIETTKLNYKNFKYISILLILLFVIIFKLNKYIIIIFKLDKYISINYIFSKILNIIFIILFFYIFILLLHNNENFTTYTQNPYEYQKIGTTPLSYYIKPRYRKPYRFPYKFYKSYPNKHFEYL